MPGARGARRAQERDGFEEVLPRVCGGRTAGVGGGGGARRRCYYDEGNWAVACTKHGDVLP